MNNTMLTVAATKKRFVPEKKTRQLLVLAGGAVLGFLFATLLHFIYPLTGNSLAAAVLGSVNESVWEHMKILAVAYLLYSIAVKYFLRPSPKRLLIARSVGVLCVMLTCCCFFYIYSGILGFSVAWVDISSAFLCLLLGELVSLRIINSPREVELLWPVALAVLVLVVTAVLCFTASPPHIGLFRDPNTGLYGLEAMP